MNNMSAALIEKKTRCYLPEAFRIDSWDDLSSYFEELESRALSSKEDLEKWLQDCSELESVISEDVCWRQIRMTCDTEDPQLAKSFEFFMSSIQPMIQSAADRLNQKLIGSPFSVALDSEKYFTYLRNVRKNIELFLSLIHI